MPLANEKKELRTLINVNQDACNFYQNAAQEVESLHLKRIFEELDRLHRGVIENLQYHFQSGKIGDEPNGTITGHAAQFWGELMAKISHHVDETLVTHLEEAEDRCLHSMQEAIKSKDIRPSTRAVLQQELQALRKSHDYMKALKTNLKAA